MLRSTFLAATVAALFTLLTPGAASAWGARHVGYTHVGPNGVYHTGRTAVAGPGGAAYGGHTTAVGASGGAYHAGYGGAYGGAAYGGGGYHYTARYGGAYGGGAHYSYVR